jgi:adenosylcobyric acid synthase
MAKSIMIQGAGSNVGKSMLVAGIARALVKRGYSVRPFKPQNMSNNASVTMDGGEIGRAQALQAIAAGVDPVIDMNPVLLKPESDVGAQVIVHGKRFATLKAREYAKVKPTLLKATLDSFHRLKSQCDFVIVEGAGSPAEINLRAGDIANMGFAQAADVPVVLVGDIDRGGVIAQCVGTHVVLPIEDRDRIKAFAINKFRGDPTLFDDGLLEIVKRTGWPSLGVIPWFSDAWKLPAEDIMDIAGSKGSDGTFKIAVPRLNRIANFDDLDPLTNDPNLTVQIIEAGHPLPGDADLVLIPGSKSTIADLAHFRAQGWDTDLFAHVRRGGSVLGLCGGYQMLGRHIHDPEGIEGPACSVAGLGLLDVTTVMTPQKTLTQTNATFVPTGDSVAGYEIHIGETTGPDTAQSWLEADGRMIGAANTTGQIKGTYMHGLFTSNAFRTAYLKNLGADATAMDYSQSVEDTLDTLAQHLETHMDIDQLIALAN